MGIFNQTNIKCQLQNLRFGPCIVVDYFGLFVLGFFFHIVVV